jgi:hypothetical protein
MKTKMNSYGGARQRQQADKENRQAGRKAEGVEGRVTHEISKVPAPLAGRYPFFGQFHCLANFET